MNPHDGTDDNAWFTITWNEKDEPREFTAENLAHLEDFFKQTKLFARYGGQAQPDDVTEIVAFVHFPNGSKSRQIW